MQIPRILIAAPSSGSGKTLVTCGILQALKHREKKPVSFKCGPDYIDPMFHEKVLGIPSENLDLFLCGREQTLQLLAQRAKGADVAVIEGVMGYYDGWALDTTQGSSFALAEATGTPVILVVPCKGMGMSVVPFIEGFVQFQKESGIRGVILNGISGMLFGRLKALIESRTSVPVIGYIPKLTGIHLESRHLGLVMPDEIAELQKQLTYLAETIEETVDLNLLLQIAGRARGIPPLESNLQIPVPKDGVPVRIAVATDAAFCFYYKANLEFLERLGCELVSFSPLTDKALPADIQGLLLGGGYPELYAKELSDNSSMRNSIKSAIESGLPCIAECGGFMYLHEEMENREGSVYAMAGVISGRAFPTEKLVRFGYVTLTAQEDQTYQKAGECLKAHEFHYWDSTDSGAAYLAVKPDGKRQWNCIHVCGNLFAGYPHIHFCSNPGFAQKFAAVCAKYAERETKR